MNRETMSLRDRIADVPLLAAQEMMHCHCILDWKDVPRFAKDGSQLSLAQRLEIFAYGGACVPS